MSNIYCLTAYQNVAKAPTTKQPQSH